jgi:hypothetical protein
MRLDTIVKITAHLYHDGFWGYAMQTLASHGDLLLKPHFIEWLQTAVFKSHVEL